MSDTIRITYHAETASGRRSGWAKMITGIVDDPGIRGSKRFIGEYLREGIESDLPVGALIIETIPTGSVKNGGTDARFLRVDPEVDGGLCILDGQWDWKGKFLTIVDHAKRLLGAKTKTNELARFSLEELIAEIERRKNEP